MDEILHPIVVATVIGLGAAVVKLLVSQSQSKHALDEYKLHVAENYLKNNTLVEVRKELHALRSVVYQIAGKLGVAIHETDH